MNARLFVGAVFWASIASAAQQEDSSRLRYSPPDKWQRSVSAEENLVSLAPPGGGVSVTFTKSTQFPGTADQWLNEMWNEMFKDMQLATKPVPAQQGSFATRMGIFKQPDGTLPWVCLYTLVKNGRGEALLFFADGEKSFFEHLPAVTTMIHRITVSDTAVGPGAPRENPVATSAPPRAPAGTTSADETALPTLQYTMSPDFSIRQGNVFTAKMVDGTIHVYDFRPYRGNFEDEFRRTLLRDWIAPEVREEQLVGPPTIRPANTPGAEKVLMAKFQQAYWGTARERLRIAILAANAVAIVDINLQNADAWQRYQTGLFGLLDSIRIAAPEPPTPGGPVSTEVAGLFLAFKSQFQPNVLGGVGSGSWQMGTEYYLFSENGRVHRGRKLPNAPGGDLRRFNYDAAQRDDPANSGRYTVHGEQVIIRLGNSPFETITAKRLAPDVLSIYDVPFKRDIR